MLEIRIGKLDVLEFLFCVAKYFRVFLSARCLTFCQCFNVQVRCVVYLKNLVEINIFLIFLFFLMEIILMEMSNDLHLGPRGVLLCILCKCRPFSF